MRIAITGIGVVSAIGTNCAETVRSLLSEKTGIGAMRYTGSVHTDIPVGEVPLSNEELKRMAGIDGNEVIPRTSLIGLLAAREALEQSALSPALTEVAFINGTTVGGMDLTERHLYDYTDGKAVENICTHGAGESALIIAGHLSSVRRAPFSLIATSSTACSSALNAVMLGANLLRTGQAKAALVGGTESLSRFHLNGFNTLMILDRQPCRPFDADRAGLNLGEGAGYLVIEPEEEALARGAEILGYISGYANTCDAFHQTASSENGEGAYLAMQGALQMAGLQPSDIDYVNAHGTATPNNDLSESAALRRIFGDAMPAVSSTKAFTGHTTSASGGLEAAVCVLAMNNGFIPANLHWSRTAEGLVTPVTRTVHRTLNHILCNAFAFGGNESSIVISRQPTELSVQPATLSLQPAVSIEQNDDTDVASYVSGAEARRMTVQTRRIVAAARRAMQESGVTQPDAIVCATQWGCLVQSIRFLTEMIDSSEQQLKPTPFIQSTHNTIASLIAMLTGNHGYNCTYSQGRQSLDCALKDIETQMSLGLIDNALVLEFDEQEDLWDRVLANIGQATQAVARAHIYIK